MRTMCKSAVRRLKELCGLGGASVRQKRFFVQGALALLLFLPFREAIGYDLPAPGTVSAEHGCLSGRVADPTDAVIPGAVVTIQSVTSRVEQRTETDKVGRFQFRDLALGQYTISITRDGFAEFRGKFTVTAGKLSASFDARLKIATAEGAGECRPEGRHA